jgi:hypothetical protein
MWLFAPKVATVTDTAIRPTTVTDATKSSSLEIDVWR